MKTYKDFLKGIKQKEPSKTLFDRIIQNIKAEENFIILRRKIMFISISTIISMSLFIFSIVLIRNKAVETGFSSFSSLIFSDFNIILQNRKNFIISLLETIPITNVILSLLIGAMSFFFIKVFLQVIKIFNNYKQNNNYKLIN